MGSIEFEGWSAVVDNIVALNRSREISRLGLMFEKHPGLISAFAKGNVSAYYIILIELKQRIVSGGFNGTVEFSNGEKKTITVAKDVVIENGKDITEFLDAR